MSARSFVFTSESVTEGHPDKMADCLSDLILDSLIGEDPLSRVACETLVKTGMVVVAGEITSRAVITYSDVVRRGVLEIGYNSSEIGFDGESCAVLVALDRQSPDISQGVTVGQGLHKEQGAGDQGLMFGFACRETPELMPLPIMLAHALTRRLAEVRRQRILPWVRPDGKSQVTVRYEEGRPVRIETVVVSTQHAPELSHAEVEQGVREHVIGPVLPRAMLPAAPQVLVNPTGRFVVGGPKGDCGLTGRKIIVDTYGGMSRHGGGAFSGKDPSKVDRSASYMARYVAKNVVAAGLAERCEVQLAYAIGYADPLSVLVDTFGTGQAPDEAIGVAVRKAFGLRPAEIIEQLDLLRPIYRPTAAYGHFGREDDLSVFTWERTDRTADLLAALG